MTDKKIILVDIEVYNNAAFAILKEYKKENTYFYQLVTGELLTLNGEKKEQIKDVVSGNVLLGYNSNRYDFPIISLAEKLRERGAVTNKILKDYSNEIINNKRDFIFIDGATVKGTSFHLSKVFDCWCADAVDVFMLRHKTFTKTNKRKTVRWNPIEYSYEEFEGDDYTIPSLKKFGVEYGIPFQLSPYSFDNDIPLDEIDKVIRYCHNDVLILEELVNRKYEKILVNKTLFEKFQINENYFVSDSSLTRCIFVRDELLLSFNTDINKNGKLFYPEDLNFPLQHIPKEDYFDFKKKIEESINVLIEHNLTWNKRNLVKLMKEKYNRDIEEELVYKVGELEINLGLGGIHSTTDNVVYDNVVDIDVTSFYPILILAGCWSRKMNNDARSLFAQCVNDRIAAKKAKDKIRADAYKIVINSLYGIFGSSSIEKINDYFAAKSVTICGQLLAWDLLWMFHNAGHKVIAANTDGVSIVPKDDSWKDLLEQWKKNKIINNEYYSSPIDFETTLYDRIYFDSINSYIAIKDGKIAKSKGEYGNTGSSISAVTKTINYWISKGLKFNDWREVYTYLRSLKKDDFLFLRKIENDSSNENKIVYFAIDGSISSKSASNKENTLKVYSGGEITDIDFGRYFLEVVDTIQNFIDNTENYSKIKNINVGVDSFEVDFVDAQNNKKLKKGFKYSDRSSWSCSTYSSAYRIPMLDALVCFDIDEPENVHGDLLQKLDSENTLKIYRTGFDGRIIDRKAYIFAVKPEQKNVDSFGIGEIIPGTEILHGSQSKVVAGLHFKTTKNGTYVSEYMFEGEIKTLPDYLYTLFPEKRFEPSSNIKINESTKDSYSILKYLFELTISKNKLNYVEVKKNGFDSCFFYIDKDDPGHASTMLFFRKERGGYVVRCKIFNTKPERVAKHEAFVELLNKELESSYNLKKKLTTESKVTQQPVQNDGSWDEVLKLLDENKIVHYSAPTGSGKTEKIIDLALHRLELGKNTTIVLPSKELIREYESRIVSKSKAAKDFIEIICSETHDYEGSLEIDSSDDNHNDDEEKPKIYLMIYSYMMRKGLSLYCYARGVKIFNKKSNMIIIDEADKVFDNAKFVIESGVPFIVEDNYYKPKRNYYSGEKIEDEIEVSGAIISKCKRTGLFFLDTFEAFRSDKREIDTQINLDGLIVEDSVIDEKMKIKVTFYKDIKNVTVQKNSLEDFARNDHTPTFSEAKMAIQDLIQHSINLAVFQNFFEADGDKKYNIEDCKKSYDYVNNSYESVSIKQIVGIDLLPIKLINFINTKNKTPVLLASATTNDDYEKILSEINAKKVNDKKFFQKFSRINVLKVVTGRKLTFTNTFIENGVPVQKIFGKTLVFTPKKKDTLKSFFKEEKNKNTKVYSEGVFISKTETPREDVLLTYAASSIGIGKNLPQFDCVVRDGEFRVNPVALSKTSILKERSVVSASSNYDYSSVIQNIGRIMRHGYSTVKNVIIFDSNVELSYLSELCLNLVERKVVFHPSLSKNIMAAILMCCVRNINQLGADIVIKSETDEIVYNLISKNDDLLQEIAFVLELKYENNRYISPRRLRYICALINQRLNLLSEEEIREELQVSNRNKNDFDTLRKYFKKKEKNNVL